MSGGKKLLDIPHCVLNEQQIVANVRILLVLQPSNVFGGHYALGSIDVKQKAIIEENGINYDEQQPNNNSKNHEKCLLLISSKTMSELPNDKPNMSIFTDNRDDDDDDKKSNNSGNELSNEEYKFHKLSLVELMNVYLRRIDNSYFDECPFGGDNFQHYFVLEEMQKINEDNTKLLFVEVINNFIEYDPCQGHIQCKSQFSIEELLDLYTFPTRIFYKILQNHKERSMMEKPEPQYDEEGNQMIEALESELTNLVFVKKISHRGFLNMNGEDVLERIIHLSKNAYSDEEDEIEKMNSILFSIVFEPHAMFPKHLHFDVENRIHVENGPYL